jgi:uncharacterized protein
MNVVVLGASDNPNRFSWLAVHNLQSAGHKVFPVGNKNKTVLGLPIINSRQPLEQIDIITIYLNYTNQLDWYDFILKTNPTKLIFNPGAENSDLGELAVEQGIQVIEACTLVLLNQNAL